MTRSPATQVIIYNPQGPVVFPVPAGSYLITDDPTGRHIIRNGTFEASLIEWAKQFLVPGKTFLDIGAHAGTYTLAYAGLVPHVHAFEPCKSTYYKLCATIALNGLTNVTAHQRAATSPSHHNCTLTLVHESPDGGGNYLGASGTKNTEDVVGLSIDTLNLSGVGFVKIDVEGHELQVLQGMCNTIINNEITCVMFECNDKMNALPEITQYVASKFGYKVVPISGTNNMFLATKG